jgi:hypothetical protein
MHKGARSGNVVSHNIQFAAAFKEQQAIGGRFDHVQSNRYVAALALVLSGTACLIDAENIALLSS